MGSAYDLSSLLLCWADHVHSVQNCLQMLKEMTDLITQMERIRDTPIPLVLCERTAGS